MTLCSAILWIRENFVEHPAESLGVVRVDRCKVDTHEASHDAFLATHLVRRGRMHNLLLFMLHLGNFTPKEPEVVRTARLGHVLRPSHYGAIYAAHATDDAGEREKLAARFESGACPRWPISKMPERKEPRLRKRNALVQKDELAIVLGPHVEMPIEDGPAGIEKAGMDDLKEVCGGHCPRRVRGAKKEVLDRCCK